MRRPSPLVSRGSETDIDSAMTPMIDVVFLLLVFFVWTASFQIVEHVMPSELSEQIGSDPIDLAEPPAPKDFEDVVVTIGWNGELPNWEINKQPFPSLAEVQKRLMALSNIGADAPIILHPEPVVPLGHVIEAYDVAKVSGFEQVSFAVNNPVRQ